MQEALLWGSLSSASLLIGAGIALRFKLSRKIIGLIMAFGVGALVSSVCFELVGEAFSESKEIRIVIIGIATGALTYFIGDTLIDKFGARKAKKSATAPAQQNTSGLSILLGTVLDGIPESIVIGLTIVTGGSVSIAMLFAVFLSNIPEALASSTGLRQSGWKTRSIIGLWFVVVLVSALASLLGYVAFADTSSVVRAFILSFAGGAILTMLANSMLPEAYRESGKLTGLLVVLGFCLTFVITTLE